MTTEPTGEMIRAGGQIVVDSAADARRALGEIFGDAARELAAILGDHVRLWRTKNLLEIADKARVLLEERGLPPEAIRALPLGDAVRVMEAASSEDHPTLQAMWARLLANVATGAEAELHRPFVELLRILSPADALLIDLLWERWQALQTEDAREGLRALEERVEREWLVLTADQRELALQNLLRLRLITRVAHRQFFQSMFEEVRMEDGRHRRFTSVRSSELVRALEVMERYAIESGGGGGRFVLEGSGPGRPDHVFTAFEPTSLGAQLMRACER